MKQTLFLIAAFVYMGFRSFADPFWAVLLYYGLAVLRPQAIWEWSLPQGVRWSLYAAILAVVTLLLRRASVARRVERGFDWSLAGFGVATLVSYLVAMNQEIAGKYGWEYVKIFVMLIVGTYVVNQKWHLRYLGLMVFACLIYLVYEANSLYIFDHRLDIYRYGYGGLDNNGAALMLAMVLPFCYYYFQAEKRWWRWGYIFCIIPTAHIVMLTYSRGAMLSGIAAGVGMTLTNKGKRVQGIIAVLVLGVFVVAMAGPEVRARFMTVDAEERDASAQSRVDSWRAGMKIWADHPALGVGIRNSNLLTKQYGADMQGRTIHNVYIQILADSGPIACGSYVMLILLSLRWLRRSSKDVSGNLGDKEDRWHYCTCKACLWSLFTFAFGSFFLSLEQFELPYLLFLMAAMAPGLGERRPSLVPQSRMKSEIPALESQ